MGLRKGVRVLAPKDAIAPTGTWSLGARAGDFVFVAGMRGINPVNNRLIDGDEARIRLAFADAFRILNDRISLFVALPLRSFDKRILQQEIDSIGKAKDSAA